MLKHVWWKIYRIKRRLFILSLRCKIFTINPPLSPWKKLRLVNCDLVPYVRFFYDWRWCICWTGIARLGSRCLSAVSAYDNTLENMETLDAAQAKFDDILSSPSIDFACQKIKSLAKAKELDSTLILLISSAWAKAKESTTMKNEVWIWNVILHGFVTVIPSSLKIDQQMLLIVPI